MKKLKMLLHEEAKEFCLNTCAHGFKLIALPKRCLFERILWIIITAIFILVAISLSWLTWLKIRDVPTITQTDSPNYPIWNYPFPAVTVCNFNTISRKRAFATAQNLKKPQNVTVNELAWSLRLLYHLIDGSVPETSHHRDFTTLQDILDDNDVRVEELLQHLAPNCKEMLQRCLWKGQHLPCEKLFQQIKTTEGFCCSFNYFALQNNTFNSVRTTSTQYKIQHTPRRVSATGYQTALETVVNSLPEDYFATPFSSFGHRVLVHYPYTFPGGNALKMLQSTRGLIFIGVKPILYRSDAKLTRLPISERNCLFKEEKELLYFEYTYFNCISECRANITKELCGCTPFYYHYGSSNNDSLGAERVCNLQDVSCLFENKRTIENSIPGHNEDSKTTKHGRLPNGGRCPCLPDCNYCYYSLEGSAGEFHKEYAGNKPILYGGVHFVNQSVFRIFFDDLVSTRYTTSVRYYWHTSLGLFGGILGLLTGFSIVSLIEMGYFFTVKLILDFIVQRKTRKNKKTQQSKPVLKQP